MAKKGDGPKTGKIPIDAVTLLYEDGKYKYDLRFRTQGTVAQATSVVTYRLGADGSYAIALSYLKPTVPKDGKVLTNVTNLLWPGNYLTVAFSEAADQGLPAPHRYHEPMSIDHPLRRPDGPKTGKIPIDGIELHRRFPSDPTTDLVLDLDVTDMEAGGLIHVRSVVVLNDGSFNQIHHEFETQCVAPNDTNSLTHIPGSFERPMTHSCDVTVITMEGTRFQASRRKFFPIGMG